jgi:uncharacterized protein involved in copper resistance
MKMLSQAPGSCRCAAPKIAHMSGRRGARAQAAATFAAPMAHQVPREAGSPESCAWPRSCEWPQQGEPSSPSGPLQQLAVLVGLRQASQADDTVLPLEVESLALFSDSPEVATGGDSEAWWGSSITKLWRYQGPGP